MEFNADASCGMFVTALPAALVPSRDIERASSDIFATSSLTLMLPSDWTEFPNSLIAVDICTILELSMFPS